MKYQNFVTKYTKNSLPEVETILKVNFRKYCGREHISINVQHIKTITRGLLRND